MDDVYGGQRWSEGPRVRVRRRGTIRSGTWPPGEKTQVTTDPLRGALRAAERRFLALQGMSAEGRWSEALEGYQDLMAELRMIGNRLGEHVGRRDLTFLADRRLNLLQDHCLWLARRVSSALLLVLQLRLEQELKRLSGPRGYQVYLRLEDVADAAHEVEALSEHDLMARLRDGTLWGDLQDQESLPDETARPTVEPSVEEGVR